MMFGIGIEFPLPQAGADHRHRIAALRVAVFGRREDAARQRMHAQHGEIVPRHQFAPHALALVVVANAQRPRLRHSQTGEQRQVVAVVAVIRVRSGEVVAVGSYRFERSQFIAVRYAGKRPHQHRIDPTENRGVGGNSNSQRQHRQKSEPRLAQRDTKSIAEILQQGSHR
jgi:hypothetical protein